MVGQPGWLGKHAARQKAGGRGKCPWTPLVPRARLRSAGGVALAHLGDDGQPEADRMRGAVPEGRKSSKESAMSVYRVTEIIGTSGTSWEDAAAEAIRTAAITIRDLRVAEVVKQDIALNEDGAITYRTKLQLSFKYENEH
jgi:flavin-binding protein dodecin